jgi:transposase
LWRRQVRAALVRQRDAGVAGETARHRELAAVKREIRACAKDDPRVSVLTRIRGVGVFIALLVVAEVGDITRFPSARQLASFAGLTPHVRNSGERVRLGAISHQGSPHLRWGLIQAAQTAVQADGLLKTFYERIKHRRGSNVAKVAVAARSAPTPWPRSRPNR